LKDAIKGSLLYRRSYQLNGKTINFDAPATIAFETLSSEEERRQINESIHQLARFSEKELVDKVNKLLTPEENVYMMSTGDLRIIYGVDGDVIEIEDIFHKKRLDIFRCEG